MLQGLAQGGGEKDEAAPCRPIAFQVVGMEGNVL